MNKISFLQLIKIIFITMILLMPSFNFAKEILIYADDINYDEDQNIIAKGNAKIFQDNKLLISDLIIYNKKDNKIILPSEFTFKDEGNNFFFRFINYY